MFDIIVLSSSKMVNHVLDQTLKAASNSFHIITPFNNTNTEPSVKITVTNDIVSAIENRIVLVITNDCYLPKFWEVQFLRTLQLDTTQVLVPAITDAKYIEQQCPLFETFTDGIYLEKLDWYNRCSKPTIKQISNCSVDASLFGYTTFVDTPLDERNWNVLQSCIIGNSAILLKDTNSVINLLDLI
jgi:hypothetical protein